MDSDEEEKMCRYCLSTGGGELIAPCQCRGGQKWVHLECLRAWQRMVLVNQSTHPYFYEKEHRQEICNVCKTKFTVPPPDYHEMVSGLAGEDVVSKIAEGFLIVRTQSSSEQSRRFLLTNGHIPSVRRNLEPWIGGVYLIVGISPDRDCESERGQDSVYGVNLTKELGHVSPIRLARCHNIVGEKKVYIRHFDGGPCNGLHAFSCMRFVTKEEALAAGVKLMDQRRCAEQGGGANGLVISGSLSDVAELAHKDWERENLRRGICSRPEPVLPKRMICLAWGDGHWSRTQLIGEIARGGWGMCKFNASDVFVTPTCPTPPSPIRLFSCVHNARRPVAPTGPNPMTRAMNESLDVRPFVDTDAAARHRQQLRKQLMENHRRAQEKLKAQRREQSVEEASHEREEKSNVSKTQQTASCADVEMAPQQTSIPRTPVPLSQHEDMEMTPQSAVSTTMHAAQSPLPMQVGSPALPNNNGPPMMSLSLSSSLPTSSSHRLPQSVHRGWPSSPAQFPPDGGDIQPENF